METQTRPYRSCLCHFTQAMAVKKLEMLIMTLSQRSDSNNHGSSRWQ
ncbi:MAG: hypothetical protein SAL70_43575 [Scytonema sp. PMC 1070.18]|nr:hypothetical protein [Scytonema sp. PMC 1070.18]